MMPGISWAVRNSPSKIALMFTLRSHYASDCYSPFRISLPTTGQAKRGTFFTIFGRYNPD